MDNIIPQKQCSVCLQTKPLTEFYPLPTGRMGVSAKCKPCFKAYTRERMRGKPKSEKKKASDRRYAQSEKAKAYEQQHRQQRRIHLYNLTLQQYEDMRDKQGGVCCICKQPPNDDKRLCIDHCHRTGRIRGLLCETCNWMLGHARDDVAILTSAIQYLQR